MEIHKNLWKGSLILLITFNVFNALNFFFHFAMVRLLTIADYGILATLFTITYILAVFSESIQVVITKYSSSENDKGRLKNLLKRALSKSLVLSTAFFAVYLIASIFLSSLLKIDYLLMALNGLIIFVVFFSPITRGILQGKKRFKALGWNMIIEAVIKFVLAIVFVVIGWKVYGAILGTIIGMILAIALSFVSLRDITKAKEKEAKIEGIYGYGKPAFIITLVILAFYSIDIIIAKIVFPPEVAGVYAIASILAKTIFAGTQPISKAMFPITSNDGKVEGKHGSAFMNALFLLIGLILIALVAFYFLPELIIRIFSGQNIQEAASILIYLGIAVSLVSISNIVLLYKLSRGKIKNSSYFLIFLVVEIGLLIHFSSNLVEFSIAFVTASAILLWGTISLLKN